MRVLAPTRETEESKTWIKSKETEIRRTTFISSIYSTNSDNKNMSMKDIQRHSQ